MTHSLLSDSFERIRTLLDGAGHELLDVLIALAVVAVTWVIAALVLRVLRALLRALRFNSGVRAMMESRTGDAREPASFVAWIVHWVIIIAGVVLAFDVLGLSLGDSLAARMEDILPRVLTAAILLVAGVFVAMALGTFTRRFFQSAGIRGSRIRGQVVSVVFTFVAVLLALEQLGFAAQFVMGVGLVLAGAAGLALALAVGLGCRDLVRDFVVEYLRSLEEERPRRP